MFIRFFWNENYPVFGEAVCIQPFADEYYIAGKWDSSTWRHFVMLPER